MPPNKAKGSIIVNANSPKKRQYFTIAHELCHLVHGRHKPLPRDKGRDGLFFQCSQQDMRSRGRGILTPYQRQEVQANQFAAELLMPRYRMRSELKARPNLESVLSLSLSLGVSKETAAQRLVKLHDDAIAIVFIKNGKVRYWAKPDNFPRVKYWNGHALPAALLKTSGKTLSPMDEAEPEDWFEGPDGKYLETQMLLQQNGFAMVMLYLEFYGEEASREAEDAIRF